MTEHLPIQRWTKVFTRYPASEVLPNENGEYVTYADHLAALRACERQMLEEHRHRCSGCDWCYSDGVRESLDAAREAVEGLRGWSPPPQMLITAALDAIDALREEQAPPPLPPSVGVPTKPMWPLREEQK